MEISLTLLPTFLLLSLIHPTISQQQSYDPTDCSTSIAQLPGSTYLCNSNNKVCDTFIIYRAQLHQNLSTISSLFNMDESKLKAHQTDSDQNHDHLHLWPGREFVIPVSCGCPDHSSQAIFTYNNTDSYPFSRIACEVYEGLVKAEILTQQNANNGDGRVVQVPVKCACASKSREFNGTEFLVVYPILEKDNISLIAGKFGVPEAKIRDANRLDRFATIFEHTTLLIPTTGVPVLNLDVVSNTPIPGAVIPVDQIIHGGTKTENSFLFISAIMVAVFFFLVIIWLLISFLIRRRSQPLPNKNSEQPPFTPDFLDGMSKLKNSLISFDLDELRLATDDFSDDSLLGKSVYKGRIGGSYMAIEEMISVESAQHVLYILTKINHFNVVKLEGCCYYVNKSYLVFEFAENGSLKDCLSDLKTRKQLSWAKRMQIAFDLAEGLHYIHYCTKPTYVHRNITSGNVLVTGDWRAKISAFKLARPLAFDNVDSLGWNETMVVGKKGYLAPEYLDLGRVSTKVDVYAYGVVLLELLSAKEVITEGKWLKDCVGFLADGKVGEDSSGCLEKFKMFMDPVLEGDYNLGDAMCLALLGKCCTQDDPHNRPTMNDVLKALSRIL